MKIKVGQHNLEIVKEPINEREIDITKCKFEFDEAITNEYVKEAYFTFKGTSYKEIIINNECDIPNEVLAEKGQVEIGVVAFLVEDEEEIKRYNPSPAYFNTWDGSLKDNTENSEPITPSEMEQYEQALQDGLTDIQEAIDSANNLDIDVQKIGNTATVTITKQDETTKSVNITDGQDGINGQDAKINGINTLTVEAGENISISQSGSTMTISSIDTTDYLELTNKPQINSVTLSGNKSLSDLGIQPSGSYLTSESDPIFTASASYGISSSDITNWNNKGTYSKPSEGIPKTDLSSAVQTSLGKADTALQNETYTGTITGITMNGTSKGTSGVVDLGTVITSHQDISGKEDKTNKVTSLNSSSTDTQYPSAKCVYDIVGNIESLLGGI